MKREIVAGFEVRLDVAYDTGNHMWVEVLDSGRAAVGLDPLIVEANGTLAAVACVPAGAEIRRGDPFGSLEAEKFVGPLTAPLSGLVTEVNSEVAVQPSLVDADPYSAWLVEIDPADLDAESPSLVRGESEIRAWFAAEVEDYRLKGVLAE